MFVIFCLLFISLTNFCHFKKTSLKAANLVINSKQSIGSGLTAMADITVFKVFYCNPTVLSMIVTIIRQLFMYALIE